MGRGVSGRVRVVGDAREAKQDGGGGRAGQLGK